MNTAFLFPGQASQYVGMGKDLYESDSLAKTFYDRADRALPFDLLKVCFEGPEEELKQTMITQPAIFVHSIIVAELLKKKGARFQVAAGHSLGEYTALVAAGVMDFDEALDVVALRGSLMQNAGNERPGTMAAVIGFDEEKIREVCEKASTENEVVVPANFNGPGQIVISGDVPAVKRAMDIAKDAGAKTVIQLVVSGAFHSPLMVPAAEKLAERLNNIFMRPPNVPVYMNVTGEATHNQDIIRMRLVDQLTHPVKWEQSIRNMITNNVSKVVEVGPGKVLRGLVKRISRDVQLDGVDKISDIEKFEVDV